jgi:predicted RNase H-like nuclease (RuvC/YqgF family)
MMRKNSRVFESKMKKLDAEANTLVDVETFLKCKDKCKTLEDENADLCKKIEDLENTIATMKKSEDAIDVEIGAEEILDLKKKLNEMVAKNNRLRKLLNEQRMSKLEKKESRFSQLRKSIEDEEEVIVDDEIVEDDDIEDNEIEVTDNGIEVVADTERDEDEIMEKALAGTLGK